MNVELNGQSYDVPTGVETISDLLHHLGLSERILVVEHNLNILQKDEYDTPIADRDKIEIIHFVGGG